jgi:hypothetical protein
MLGGDAITWVGAGQRGTITVAFDWFTAVPSMEYNKVHSLTLLAQ